MELTRLQRRRYNRRTLACYHIINIDQKGFLEKTPHMVRRVDLFHFHFRINVAVIEKIYVGLFHLHTALRMRNHRNDIVQCQQTIALNLRVDILAHRAAGQQLHQLDVVLHWAGVLQFAGTMAFHEFGEMVER